MKLLAVVRRIQRVLAVLVGVVPRLEDARGSQRRTSLAHWQAQRDLDDLKVRHETAQAAVVTWLRDHQWRLRFHGLMGATRPATLAELERKESQERRWLKEANLNARREHAKEEASVRRLKQLEAIQAKSQVRLQLALAHLDGLDGGAVPVLRGVANADQGPLIDQALPPEPEHEAPEPQEELPYHFSGRPRLRPRPGIG